MGNAIPEIRKFSGLYLQANSFEVPDGAMEVARNVEIQNDGIVQKTRGWYTYWTPPALSELQAITTYEESLLAIGSFGVYLLLDDTSLDQNSPIAFEILLPGAAFTLTYTAQFATQNKNLYFTTNQGLMKLEGISEVRKAGVPPGLDLRGSAGNSAVGQLPADSNTGYRVLFGRRDENGNLLLGAPSDVAYVSIPADGTSLSYTRSGGGPYTVTVTLPSNSGWTTGQDIIVTNGSNPAVDGTQAITVVALSATDISFTLVADPGATGTLDISFARDAYLEFSIPSEIDTDDDGWFYQVYRSTSSADLDVAPSPDFALIAEVMLTDDDIDAGDVVFHDDVDPLFVGALLYTNPNTREGELQANARPPKVTDIVLYKDYLIGSNVTTRQRLQLQLINPSDLLSNDISFKCGATTEVYEGGSVGVQNQTVDATSVSGTGTVTITYASHGASNGWEVDLLEVTGSVPRGTYVISGVTANTFDITSPGNSATAISFAFVTNGTNAVFFVDGVSTSAAQQVANTAYYLVKAINRTSAIMYANYSSTFDDPPGRIRIETKFFELFPLYVKQQNAATPFLTPLPTDFSSGTQVYAESDQLKNHLAISKVGEPEAWPILQLIPVGSAYYENLRIFVIRDSLIILRPDGIYKMSGDTIDSFQVTVVDETVSCVSAIGVDAINNLVHAISNQGVVAISENAVRIISRRIDDPIQAMMRDPDELAVICGFGYETARTFYLSVQEDINGQPPRTWLYNVLNETWTDTDKLFRTMCIGPEDVAFAIKGAEANVLIRQRKALNSTDYCDEFNTGTAIKSASNRATVNITGRNTFTPAVGDIVVYNEIVNRISAVAFGSNGWELTFQNATNIPASTVNIVMYQGFKSVIKFAPFHAGQVGREKFFSQFEVTLRQFAITELEISFATQFYGGSQDVDWEAVNVTQTADGYSTGWGYEPWGLFPWGLSETIDLRIGTLPSLPIRTLVPDYAARSAFIQPILSHRQAGEPMLIQALTYVVRGYGERLSK